MEYQNHVDLDQAPGGIRAMTDVYDHMLTTNGNSAYSLGHPSMRSNTLGGTFDMTSMQPGRIAGDDAYQTTQDIFPAQDFSALQEFCEYPDDMTFGPEFLDAQPVPMPTVNDYSWLEYDQNLDETGPDPNLGASSLGLNRLDVQQEDSEDCTDHLGVMMPPARFDFEAPYKEAQASVHDSGIFCSAPLNPLNAECMSGKRKKAVLPTSSSASDASKSGSRSRPRKIRHVKFLEDQIRPLYTWLENHLSDPFPEAEDKIKLSSASGLSIPQIESWFARTRRRKLSRIELPSNNPQISQADEDCGVQSQTPQFELDLAQLGHNHEEWRELTTITKSARLSLDPKLSRTSSVFSGHPLVSVPLCLNATTRRGLIVDILSNRRRSRSCPAAFRSQNCIESSTRALKSPFRADVASPEVVLSSLEAVPSTRQVTPFSEGSLPLEPDPSDDLTVAEAAESQFNKGIPSSSRDWGIEGFLDSLPEDGDYQKWEDPSSLVPVSVGLQPDFGLLPKSPVAQVVQDQGDIQHLADGQTDTHQELATNTSRRYSCSLFPQCTENFQSQRPSAFHLYTHKYRNSQKFWCLYCGCTFRNESTFFSSLDYWDNDNTGMCETCLLLRQNDRHPPASENKIFSMNQYEAEYPVEVPQQRAPASRASSYSSAGSVASAGSYGAFGPRKGRRVVYTTPPLESRRASVRLADTTPFRFSSLHPEVSLRLPPESDEDSESDSGRAGNSQLPGNLGEKSSRSIGPHISAQRKASYQCTFCHKVLFGKYEWRRHEESVHVPQKEWVCAQENLPENGMLGGWVCPLCGLALYYVDFFKHANDAHNASSCWQKPEKDRTFYRKDHLAQHIRQVHCQKVGKDYDIDLNAYSRPTAQAASSLKCGFCGLQNPSWDARAKHIPTHFDEGLDMSSWKPLETWA